MKMWPTFIGGIDTFLSAGSRASRHVELVEADEDLVEALRLDRLPGTSDTDAPNA